MALQGRGIIYKSELDVKTPSPTANSWGCLKGLTAKRFREFGVTVPLVMLSVTFFVFQIMAPQIGVQISGLGWSKSQNLTLDAKALSSISSILEDRSVNNTGALDVESKHSDVFTVSLDIVADFGAYIVVTKEGRLNANMQCVYNSIGRSVTNKADAGKVLTRCAALPRSVLVAR